MKKEDILKEMKAALERYKTIKEEEFYFGLFVKEYDNINECGTICCLWGWEPHFEVLNGVKWEINIFSSPKISVLPCHYLDWGDITKILYYPYDECQAEECGIDEIKLPYTTDESTLSEVLEFWGVVINLIETTDKMDHLLNLD